MFPKLVRSVRIPQKIRHYFDIKNNVTDIRKKYYEKATQPTYLKEPGDQVIFAVAIGGCGIGLLTVFYGLYSMSFGINKIQR